jgi:hypothetical protein
VSIASFAVTLLGFAVRKYMNKKYAPVSDGMEYNSNLQSLEKGLLDTARSRNTFKETEAASKPVKDGLFSWDVSKLCEGQSFEVGEAIEGKAFTAAGVPDLSLKFYPSGDHRAPKGSCTLFLQIPCGWQIAAKLFVGDFKGTCQGEMPDAGPGATWGLRGDCPRPRKFTTVGVELLLAMPDLKDQLVGA